MARQISPKSSQYRSRVLFLGLYGAVVPAWLVSACGENTERVISKIPSATVSASTGGAAGGVASTLTGGSAMTLSGGTVSPGTGGTDTTSFGGTSDAQSSTLTTGGAATGPKLAAVGTPIGFAAQGSGGTTGGGLGVTIVPADCSELANLLMDAYPRVIVVKGTLDCTVPATNVRTCEIQCDSTTGDTRLFHRALDSSANDCSGIDGATASTLIANTTKNERTIEVASNKTLLGAGSNATISGVDLSLVSSASNIIIQNLTFTNVNPLLVEAGDAITINGANHVWIDHCAFNLISDGFIDMPNPSGSTTMATFVTVSWNHFDGRNDAACGKQHNYANTIENATATFHHNFWDHTLGCSPKVTKVSSRAHLFNNYWLSVLYYSIGVDKNAQALIEYNDFNDSKRPYWGMNTCISDATCFMSDNGGSNIFEGISTNTAETKSVGGTVTAFPYTVSPTPAANVKADVTQGAGPTLSISVP
jgi:pectate lyase